MLEEPKSYEEEFFQFLSGFNGKLIYGVYIDKSFFRIYLLCFEISPLVVNTVREFYA